MEGLDAYRTLEGNLVTSDGRGEPIEVAEISASAFSMRRVGRAGLLAPRVQRRVRAGPRSACSCSGTRGPCAYCGRELTRVGMARHLGACEERRKAIAAADRRPGSAGPVFHLQVQDAWRGDYGEPMLLVNSARTGMCGYEGPGEPPY